MNRYATATPRAPRAPRAAIRPPTARPARLHNRARRHTAQQTRGSTATATVTYYRYLLLLTVTDARLHGYSPFNYRCIRYLLLHPLLGRREAPPSDLPQKSSPWTAEGDFQIWARERSWAQEASPQKAAEVDLSVVPSSVEGKIHCNHSSIAWQQPPSPQQRSPQKRTAAQLVRADFRASPQHRVQADLAARPIVRRPPPQRRAQQRTPSPHPRGNAPLPMADRTAATPAVPCSAPPASLGSGEAPIGTSGRTRAGHGAGAAAGGPPVCLSPRAMAATRRLMYRVGQQPAPRVEPARDREWV